MRRLIPFMLLFWLLAPFAIAADNPIVGLWAADTRSTGGLGSTMTFTADGNETSTFGALVDCKYSADGKTLKTIYTDGKSTPMQQLYEIKADKLLVRDSDTATPEIRTRVGQPLPNAPPIVGTWTFKHYTGIPATWQYTTTGLAQLSVPMRTVKGHYKLDDDQLTIEAAGQPTTQRKIVLTGDHLTLQADGPQPEQHFSRVAP